MNKKIFYGIFLLSLFILSTASMAQPVRGYTWGVPKQAIGVTSEGEIKVFDEDEWEKHFGSDGSTAEDLFSGDADKVGAKSKSKYLEMETDEKLIPFLEDYLLAKELPESVAAGLGTTVELDYLAVMDIVDNMLLSFAGSTTSQAYLITTYGITTGPLTGAAAQITAGVALAFGADPNNGPLMGAAAVAAGATQTQAAQGSLNATEVIDIWGTDYDGSILTRDKWDYTDKAYKEKADAPDDEVPFLADPHDWYDFYQVLPGYRYDIYYRLNILLTQWMTWKGNLDATLLTPNPYGPASHPYAAMNATLVANGLGSLGIPRNLTAINPAHPNCQRDVVQGLYMTILTAFGGFKQIMDGILLGKGGLFWALMVLGLPGYSPIADYIQKVVKEFHFSDNDIEYNVLFLPLGVGVTMDIKVENEKDVVIDFEYEPEDPLDPTDPLETDPDELEDFTAVFSYGDTGGQSTVTLKAGNKIFYQSGGVESIPGYELTIILGVSAVSILGLIYVIMKKRKM